MSEQEANNKRKKIEDVGEFIPYARKHQRQESLASDSEITLKALWPEPNWKQMIESGVCPHATAYLWGCYHTLRKKPRKGGRYWANISSEMWETGFITGLQLFKSLFEQVSTLEEAKNLNLTYARSLGYKDTKEPAQADMTESFVYWSLGRGERKLKPPLSLTDKYHYLSKSLSELGWPESNKALKYGRFVVGLSNGLFAIGWVDGNSTWLEKEHFECREDAIDELRDRLEMNDQKNDERPKVPTKPSVKDVERIGVDFRTGDISPETLLEIFGFKGLQFGESMSNVEKQRWINEIHDAMYDFSDIIGFPPKWISLGQLKLAFGARGHGNALAHFEPSLKVINLTRTSGAGSLSHEWLHMFDHRFARNLIHGDSYNYASIAIHYGYVDVYPEKSSLLTAMKTYIAIVNFVTDRQSDYYQRSNKVNSYKRSGGYWTDPAELLARAFESFIQDALLFHKRTSPWLVHGTRLADYSSPRKEDFPYPLGAERRQLNTLFATLFIELNKQN